MRTTAVAAYAIWIAFALCIGGDAGAQEPRGRQPEEERRADAILRIRLIQAQTGKIGQWPEIIADLKKTLLSVGRYESFRFTEGARLPILYGKPATAKLEKRAMQVVVDLKKETKSGYPLTLRWQTVAGKKTTDILRGRKVLLKEKQRIIQVYMPNEKSAPLFLVVDLAPPWDKDPIVKFLKKKKAKK